MRTLIFFLGMARIVSFIKTPLPVKPVVQAVFDPRSSSSARPFRVDHVSTRRLEEKDKSFMIVYKCTEGLVSSNFTPRTEAVRYVLPRAVPWDMETECIMENMQAVGVGRMVAVCWHRASDCRMLVRLDLDQEWKSTILHVLDDGPCCALYVGRNSEERDIATLMFYNGKIMRSEIDEKTPVDTWETSFVQFTARYRDMYVTGGASGTVQIGEFVEDQWVVRGTIDHKPYGGYLIRAATIQKISNGFKDPCAIYHVITLDQHGRVFVWEVRMFSSDDSIHIKNIRPGTDIMADTRRSTRMTFDNVAYGIGASRQSLSLHLTRNAVRIYPMSILDDSTTSLMTSPYLECHASGHFRETPMFYQAGEFLLCLSGSAVDIFDLELVRYYLQNPVPRTVRKWTSEKDKGSGCTWSRVEPPLENIVRKPSKDLVQKYVDFQRWMSNGDAPSSEN